MEESFFIRANIHGKLRYWNGDEGLHHGKGAKGFSCYRTKREANNAVKGLLGVFASHITFEVLPCSELPFIKTQRRAWQRLFNRAARLVVKKQKANAWFLVEELSVEIDKALLLMNRLRQHAILGEPFGKKGKNHWQVAEHVSRHVKIRDMRALEEKLKFIGKHKLL